MANTINYSIGKCSAGESFNFSRSPANDVSANRLTSAINSQNCSEPIVVPEFISETRYSDISVTLYGYSEYADASTPPKKYLRMTADGELHRCFYLTSCGVDFTGVDKFVYYGHNSIDIATGAETSGAKQDIYQGGTCASPNLLGTFDVDASAFDATGSFTTIATQSRLVSTSTGTGCQYGTEGELTRWADSNGVRTKTLSIENTEEDAAAAVAATWTDWAESFATAATHQLRTTGFVFAERQLQLRLRTRNIDMRGTPSTTFVVTVAVSRRAYGSSDPFVASDPITFPLATDTSGKILETATKIQCPAGYEQMITSVSLATS